MGLFNKKVDYDELYRKLSTEKMTVREREKAEKLLDKLEYSGDRRGILWMPLICVQWKNTFNASYCFSKAESKLGLCEEYIRIRSLPIVVNLFIEEYEEYIPKPGGLRYSKGCILLPETLVFVARAYEHGWGVEKNHEKAVEIIRETENYPKAGKSFANPDLIKNAYKEITGKEFTASESSEQKEKQAIPDAAKNQNEESQSDINFKRVKYDGGDVYEGEILNGKRQGEGKYTWANGDTYEGEWKNGKKYGHGKYTSYKKDPINGSLYVDWYYDGEWIDDVRHGHGIFVEGCGIQDKVFEGEWINGKRQGRFVWYFTNSNGGRYIDFFEDDKLVETCIPYDESIRTVEDARRAKALADGKSSSSTPVYTNSSPAAASSNLSADGVLSRDNPALKMLLDFVSENPDSFRANYNNENLNRAVSSLKKGDGLRYLFYIKRSKAFWMLKHNCVLFYTMLFDIYRNYDEEIYNNLVRRLVYKNNLADLSYEDAEYCLYLFHVFIPHGKDYEAMARCYYRLGDVKSAARWILESSPLYDEIMAFRHLQKAQNVWERGKYAYNESIKGNFADKADDKLIIAEKCLNRAQKSGHSYRLGEIQEQTSILKSEIQPYLW